MSNTIAVRSFSAHSVAAGAAMSASRGISALQGIGLSGVSALESNVNLSAKAGSFTYPICVQRQTDKPAGGAWHLAAAHAAVGVFAIDSGYEPVGINPAADGMANRLRTAEDPATVIRNRQRCRTR
ncbi:hypothetical protein AB0H76_02585 [Nocardia sp. NPDC050712]|uniref:hypothetical protein n=1 Tax=Nocardia sp. NPDC050712 TaxID=3155518 RepID=UPI0033DD41EC